MTQFQLAFDFSAPAEPVLLGLDAETIEALANDSLPEISIPEIIAGSTEPEQQPISEKPKCQILVLPEREAPRGFNRDYRITDADEIGAGGLKAKFENNLAAIRLLKQLEQENRIEATPEEKRTLVRYCGWGALAQKAFSYNYEFYDLQRELQELLTEEEHTQASASTVNAHYTSPMVINAIWRAVRRLGIQAQSRILEPAAGIGHFLGLQPEEIKSNSRVAVEIDATSAAILRLLYPDTTVRACGFQQPGLPLNFFDLAISNVPFGKYGVHDVQFKSKPRLCSAIHDYFFAKALAHIRPGGLLAFITSRYTLDKKDEYLRRHLDEHAVFLGAIRLPGGKDGAFAQNAGTEVTTDIIFLRKRMEDETGAVSPSWLEIRETSVPNEDNLFQDATINQYFLDNPHMVLGRLALAGSMYRENELTVLGHLTDDLLDSAIQNLPENVIRYDDSIREIEPDQVLRLADATHQIKNNAFDIVDGFIVVRNGDVLTRPDFSPVSRQRIHRFIQLRDTLPVLSHLLAAAMESGRLVVLTSDHGHVLDRRSTFRPATAGERYRIDDGDIGDGEMRIKSSRVLLPPPGGAMIAPWSENIRYGSKRNGYHGGVSPQECVVPLALLSWPAIVPEGFEAIASYEPDWWIVGGIDRAAPHTVPVPPVAVQPEPRYSERGQAELPFAVSSPGTWIEQLLNSPEFARQLKKAGRAAPPVDRIRAVLTALDERGGTMLLQALAQKLGEPELRMPGLVAAVRRVLNVDGYAVFSWDVASGSIVLNQQLLEVQFALSQGEPTNG